MIRIPFRSKFALAALASAALVALVPASASAAPSRAELEQSVLELENLLADALRRLRALEDGAAGDSLQQRQESIQAELVRVVGELEELRYQNGRLREELRALRRELQLRDAEVAEKLGLPPAFAGEFALEDPFAERPATTGFGPAGAASSQQQTAFTNPFLTDGEPTAEAIPETDPEFFGDDPFARARAANVGVLGERPAIETPPPGELTTRGAPVVEAQTESSTLALALPENPADALAYAKNLLIDGRFDDAEAAFAEFQQRFGDSPQAGEALFWQGEAKFLRGDFEAAKDLYIASLQTDQNGPRAPDALVALASSLQNMNLGSEACNLLGQFSRQYPNAALSVRSKAERVRQQAGCR